MVFEGFKGSSGFLRASKSFQGSEGSRCFLVLLVGFCMRVVYGLYMVSRSVLHIL